MRNAKFRSVKPEIRVVGVDDGFFVPHTWGKCDVVGIVFRGGYWLDGVMRTQVEVDGMDATEKIASMIMSSPHYGQLRVIMLDGVTFAGFNVVDTLRLFEKTGLPVIAVTREKPDLDDIRRALGNLPFAEERWKAIKNADRIIRVSTRKKEEAVFMQVTGFGADVAKRIVKSTATRSNIPEALRVAHLIASGLTGPLQE
ncbi:MAG: DUF99 family protein [Candidatus Bathyarchaeota archaeon]|nr:DUF99 family protein [Candidatus Bathyarchaeota archaeon]MDH5494205.1 DUF99 family protein [Candidatus Bathyarchaeota archaeon]